MEERDLEGLEVAILMSKSNLIKWAGSNSNGWGLLETWNHSHWLEEGISHFIRGILRRNTSGSNYRATNGKRLKCRVSEKESRRSSWFKTNERVEWLKDFSKLNLLQSQFELVFGGFRKWRVEEGNRMMIVTLGSLNPRVSAGAIRVLGTYSKSIILCLDDRAGSWPPLLAGRPPWKQWVGEVKFNLLDNGGGRKVQLEVGAYFDCQSHFVALWNTRTFKRGVISTWKRPK